MRELILHEQDSEVPLNSTSVEGLVLQIRATPTTYFFSFLISPNPDVSSARSEEHIVGSIESKWLSFAPPGWFVFGGASFALFASGNGEPWPFDGPEVSFLRVQETYGQDYRQDYQIG
jgi:hypothetical protein